jgi:hypothetical protein
MKAVSPNADTPILNWVISSGTESRHPSRYSTSATHSSRWAIQPTPAEVLRLVEEREAPASAEPGHKQIHFAQMCRQVAVMDTQEDQCWRR